VCGCVGSMLISLLFNWATGWPGSYAAAAGLGLSVFLASIFGDLVESSMKREANMKVRARFASPRPRQLRSFTSKEQRACGCLIFSALATAARLAGLAAHNIMWAFPSHPSTPAHIPTADSPRTAHCRRITLAAFCSELLSLPSLTLSQSLGTSLSP
jgi:hypothetical protein